MQIAERMKLHDGSTGITSIVRDGKVLVSNVGDCRCIILSNGKPIQMSVDQKPTMPEEQRRIAALGGTVVLCMGTARVNGVLAVSRAFGNRTLKSVIRPDPELSMREFTKDDDYLIMASDGLWDVLRNIDVCHISYNIANQNQSGQIGVCQMIAEELVHSALARGSLDNVTCLCMRISGPHGLYQSFHNRTANGNGTATGNASGASSPYPSQPGQDGRANAAQYRSQFNSVSPLLTGPNQGGGAAGNGNSNGNSDSGPNSSAVSDMLSQIMSSTSGGNRAGRGGNPSHNPNGNGPPNIGSNPPVSAANTVALRAASGKKPHVYQNNYTQSRMGLSSAGGMHGQMDAVANANGNSGFAEMKTDLSSSLGANNRQTKGMGTMGKSQSLRRMNDARDRDDDMLLADQSVVMDGSGNPRGVSKPDNDKSNPHNSISRFMNSSQRLRGDGMGSSYGGGSSGGHEGHGGMYAQQQTQNRSHVGGGGGYSQNDPPPSPIINPHRPNTHHGGKGHQGGKRPMSVGGDLGGFGHSKQGNMPNIYQAGGNSGMGGLRISPTGHNNLFNQHGHGHGHSSHGHSQGHHSGY